VTTGTTDVGAVLGAGDISVTLVPFMEAPKVDWKIQTITKKQKKELRKNSIFKVLI
jgi:hypothetical protein